MSFKDEMRGREGMAVREQERALREFEDRIFGPLPDRIEEASAKGLCQQCLDKMRSAITHRRFATTQGLFRTSYFYEVTLDYSIYLRNQPGDVKYFACSDESGFPRNEYLVFSLGNSDGRCTTLNLDHAKAVFGRAAYLIQEEGLKTAFEIDNSETRPVYRLRARLDCDRDGNLV